jgi:hypothetical protein
MRVRIRTECRTHDRDPSNTAKNRKGPMRFDELCEVSFTCGCNGGCVSSLISSKRLCPFLFLLMAACPHCRSRPRRIGRLWV